MAACPASSDGCRRRGTQEVGGGRRVDRATHRGARAPRCACSPRWTGPPGKVLEARPQARESGRGSCACRPTGARRPSPPALSRPAASAGQRRAIELAERHVWISRAGHGPRASLPQRRRGTGESLEAALRSRPHSHLAPARPNRVAVARRGRKPGAGISHGARLWHSFLPPVPAPRSQLSGPHCSRRLASICSMPISRARILPAVVPLHGFRPATDKTAKPRYPGR